MNYTKLNNNWNANPNAPETSLIEKSKNIELQFYLNYFIFDSFKEEDKGILIFKNCYKYLFSNCNDEGYFREQYRFTHKEIPYGDFYEIKGNYYFEGKILCTKKSKDLKHYIFMMKENIIECLAEDFSFNILNQKY